MKKKLVVFTGAGISAESGLATFRDSDGLWNGFDPQEVAHIETWRNDDEGKKKMLEFYNMRRKDALKAEPNVAHWRLAELQEDFDVTIITQNVDDLHERAGSENVIHLHGEITKMCSSMNKNKTLPYAEDIKLGDKHEDGSQLRPFIVWFGEDVPQMTKATLITKKADIFVVIGTSLTVYPAANLVSHVGDEVPIYIIDKEIPFTNKYVKPILATATEGTRRLVKILNRLK